MAGPNRKEKYILAVLRFSIIQTLLDKQNMLIIVIYTLPDLNLFLKSIAKVLYIYKFY